MRRSKELFKPALLFDSMILDSGYPIDEDTGEDYIIEDEDGFGPDEKINTMVIKD